MFVDFSTCLCSVLTTIQPLIYVQCSYSRTSGLSVVLTTVD